MSRCYFCGRSTETPIGANPCPQCAADMSLGITRFECVEVSEGFLKPTGRWLVMKPDGVRRFVTPIERAELIVSLGRAFVERETFALLWILSDPTKLRQETGGLQ